MNWQVRNPLHCTADGCTAKAEIEALREQLAAMTQAHQTVTTLWEEAMGQLAEMTKVAEAGEPFVLNLLRERDTLNAALDAQITICGDTRVAELHNRLKTNIRLLRKIDKECGGGKLSSDITRAITSLLEKS